MILTSLLSLFALGVSIISLLLSRKTWLETYRPIVTARVSTNAAGNIATLYDLVVENTGNRPAVEIQLYVEPSDLQAALNPKCALESHEVENCFDPHYSIPILANGHSISTAFGKTSGDDESMWIPESRLPITIKYKDLEGHRYVATLNLFIFDTAGFAGFHYANP